MLRCPWCNQSRWASARFGKLADKLEWLTGWTPYQCAACRRHGWQRSHRTAPFIAALRRQGPLLAQRRQQIQDACRMHSGRLRSRMRMPALEWRVLPKRAAGIRADRLVGMLVTAARTTAAWLVAAFALGFGSGAMLFSGPDPVTQGGQLIEAAAPASVAPIARVEPTSGVKEATPPAVPATSREIEPAPTLSSNGGAGAPTSKTAAAPAQKAAAPPDKAAPAISSAPKPPVRLAVNRERPERARSTPPPLQVVQAPTRTAAVAARNSAPPPAVARTKGPPRPKFHGSLVIKSEPLGAVVTVDGKVVGATPLTLKVVPAGSRVVRIESDGYERWSFAARVVANKVTQVVATLQQSGSNH
jgi:hypothetical protein